MQLTKFFLGLFILFFLCGVFLKFGEPILNIILTFSLLILGVEIVFQKYNNH